MEMHPVHEVPTVPLTAAEQQQFAHMTDSLDPSLMNTAMGGFNQMHQFETLSVESFGDAETVEAVYKAVAQRSLTAESLNYDSLADHAQQLHLALLHNQNEARLYHEQKDEDEEHSLV